MSSRPRTRNTSSTADEGRLHLQDTPDRSASRRMATTSWTPAVSISVMLEKSSRTSVLGPERLALRFGGYPCLTIEQILEREVGGVSAVTTDHHIVVTGLDILEQPVYGHATPSHVQLRPVGDAVDIGDDVFDAHLLKLTPVPSVRDLVLGRDREAPSALVDIGRGSRREHRPVVDVGLPRRQSRVTGATSSSETAVDHCHGYPFLRELSTVARANGRRRSRGSDVG